MKKLLIASAALAMVAGTAQAQSSVTVYGSYDIGYTDVKMENINGKTDTGNQLKQQGLNQASGNGPLTSNRLGFRGTEDLGGGLKANFNLEFGFRADMTGDTVTTGSHSSANIDASGQALSQIQTRTSRVGLQSDKLGRLDVGYGLTGLFATVTGHSPLPGNNWVGDVAYTSDTTSGADSRIIAGAVRMNGINYTSPRIGGFTARIDAGTNTNRTDSGAVTDVRSTNNGLTVNYSAGAFALAATVHQTRADTATTAATSNAMTTTDYQAVSARYAVTKDLAVNALYANNKATIGGVQSSKNDVMQVGVSYAMGKTSLVAQYGEGEGEGANASTAQRDRKGYQVGAIYNLSKRTSAYAIYGSQENKYVNAQTSSGGTNGAAGTKEKLSGYAVGLRHSF